MAEDEKYMRRCLQLAHNGFYGAAPNPMVGAVLVREGKIIGEGYHVCCGGPHAEVNAIRSVRDENLLRDCTLYVSLEPCAHYGKTPPCADLIVEKGIPRVVVGCLDPFAKVSGRGIRKLQAAGIDVKTGVLEEECTALNCHFMTFQANHRPYITLKWAESADGFMDKRTEPSSQASAFVFSTPYTQMLVHRLRSAHQAIMIGTGTALADNPTLTNRLWAGNSPLRLVLDRQGCLPQSLRLFCDGNATRVYVNRSVSPTSYEGLPGVTVVRLDFSCDVLPQVMEDLCGLSVQSLLVEGGARLLESFLAAGLYDEIRIEQAPAVLATGVRAPEKPKGRWWSEQIDGNRIIHLYPFAGYSQRM